jgi:adenylate cyclase
MGKEIERKFLVGDSSWRAAGQAVLYRQGYLNSDKGRTVRVRIAGERAFLTIKGPSVDGVRREYEYPIPLSDAAEMLEHLCTRPLIEKTRTVVPHDGHMWEVDEFFGENAGLIIAEIELEAVDEVFSLPPWLGAEVTGDSRYYNASLVRHPYCQWKDGERSGNRPAAR